RGGDSGVVVRPGDAAGSALLRAVRREGETKMPPDRPLPAAAVQVLTRWIEKWATLADLQAHLVAPHMIEYRPRVKEMIVRSTLHVLESA
ncbi:MAG: hypothetical protein ACKOUR_11065, partial [Planctomycetota bacterium]